MVGLPPFKLVTFNPIIDFPSVAPHVTSESGKYRINPIPIISGNDKKLNQVEGAVKLLYLTRNDQNSNFIYIFYTILLWLKIFK